MLSPPPQLSEITILETIEKLADPVAPEGEWITKIDLVRSCARRELIDRSCSMLVGSLVQERLQVRCSVRGVQLCGLEALAGRLGAPHLGMIQHTHIGTWHAVVWDHSSLVAGVAAHLCAPWAGSADEWWSDSTGGER